MDDKDLVNYRFNKEQFVALTTACADGERLYRRLRREVEAGTYDLLTAEECSERMEEYRSLYQHLQSIYCP